MRDIKFRAWDTGNNIMSKGLPFEWFLRGEGTDMEFPKTGESLPLSDFIYYLDDFITGRYGYLGQRRYGGGRL
jgi:hypothetical protein